MTSQTLGISGPKWEGREGKKDYGHYTSISCMVVNKVRTVFAYVLIRFVQKTLIILLFNSRKTNKQINAKNMGRYSNRSKHDYII